jgi:hypothetical protein
VCRVSAPEYHRIRILPKHQCRRILAPLLFRLSSQVDSFPSPPKTELPVTIANRRPKFEKYYLTRKFLKHGIIQICFILFLFVLLLNKYYCLESVIKIISLILYRAICDLLTSNDWGNEFSPRRPPFLK